MDKLHVGDWIIITDDGLWGIDAYAFPTKRDAVLEASGCLDIYEIKEIDSSNLAYYQKMLKEQFDEGI